MTSVSETRTPASGIVQFVAFVATGSLAAGANVGSFQLFKLIAPFEAAVALAYVTGMVVAFILFQRMIFGNPDTPLRRRVIRFTQVNMLGLALATLVSATMLRLVFPALNWSFYPKELAQLIGVAAPTFSSYFLHRNYTYR